MKTRTRFEKSAAAGLAAMIVLFFAVAAAAAPEAVDVEPLGSQRLSPDGFCRGNVGYGLLRLASQSPFQSLRMAFLPMTPDTLPQSAWEFGLHETLANVWVNENRYHMDYETLHSAASLSYGLLDTVLLELAFEERRLFGGVLDGFIEGFHDVTGIDQDGRDMAPSGDVLIDLRDEDGKRLLYYDGGSSAFTQAFTFSAQHNVTCGGDSWPAIAYAGTVRYEIWNITGLDQDAPVDLGLSLSVSKRLWDVYLYLALGGVWYGANEVQELDLHRIQVSGLLGVEWNFHERASLLLQYLMTEGRVKDLDAFSDATHEVTLGAKVRLTRGLLLELGLVENVIIYDNSPDFGIHAGLTWRIF
ncbi:MAG: DUF3187 family protein [Desulfatibacillaceae bacterium]